MASTTAGRKTISVYNPRQQSGDNAPIANNTLLNKAASQSTSLYQQCSSLRARLMRIRGFSPFFAILSSDSRSSTDPVTHLWDLFSLGVPLCYIFNLLPPPITPVNIETSPDFDVNDDRFKKRAIALFAIGVKQVPQTEAFTVRDLWDHDSTDGLVKVINTVTTIVDLVPLDLFELPPPSPSFISNEPVDPLNPGATPVAANAQENARMNIIRELLETERKYVQDLEIMQKYSQALSHSNAMSQDLIHYLFPNLNKLLNFQRKFLIRLEGTAELPWQEQRWGLHFLENEEEFEVYEPYCANYTNASDIMLANEATLSPYNHVINAKSELPALMIKPVQRICKYPLLLDSLVKATSASDYAHLEELKKGTAAAKRITDKINEAKRHAENEQTVKALKSRVEDWKGHSLAHFGELVLDDIFVVKKSGVDREYHVFLFEKIILCCKEAVQPQAPAGKKVNKNGSILKKQATGPSPLVGGLAQTKKTTPLLLKGRIFLNNVTRAVPVSPRNSTASNMTTQYALEVWWRGDDDLEYFTLRCRSEEHMKQWEAQVNRLIKDAAQRRAVDRGFSKVVSHVSNSTSPAPLRPNAFHDRSQSSSIYPGPPPVPDNRRQQSSPYGGEEQFEALPYTTGPRGYPPPDGFEFDDDEFEDYPPPSSSASASGHGTPSGRGTPLGGQRRNNAVSMPPEHDAIPGYDRPRARTEDTNSLVMAQWRTNGSAMPPPSGPPSVSAHRPLMGPRSSSNTGYDSGFSQGVRPSQQPKLRSQFSATKLKSVYDGDSRNLTPSPAMSDNALLPPHRSRSASQPSAYVPVGTQPTPPVPHSPWISRAVPSMSNGNKRGSGSSHSTGESSDYSPNSSSPMTPFGSSESSLGGFPPPVKVKVHFHEDIFVVQVPRGVIYTDLLEKVGRKIRLCGPRRDDGPLRVKYKDEDGDLISLGSTEDVQMAFESYRPGGQVVLFVT